MTNTLEIAGRCTLDLTKNLNYTFPDYPAPDGSDAGQLSGKTVL